MNSFDDFTAFLQGPVGNALANDPGDVRATKQNLKRAGYFPGEDGNDYITRALDTGIRNFQRDNSLRIDGRLFPGGETERSLFETLTGRSANAAFGRAETEHGGFAGFGGSVSGMASSGERQSPDFTPTPLYRTGGFSGRDENGKTAQVFRVSERERQAQKDDLFQVIAEKDSPAIGGFGQPAQNTDATGRTIKPKKNIHKQEIEKKANTFPAPTFEPIDKDELQKILDFDPDKGGGDFHSFLGPRLIKSTI